jgi:hypothetical protein
VVTVSHRQEAAMPVTAKLSREFYEKLGDKIADELVTWFNEVDATYRSDLRQLNELNFSRFDAKLEQRFAEADAKWEQRMTRLDANWGQRMTQLGTRWEQRITQLEAKWEQRIAQLEASWDQRLAQLDAKWVSRVADLRNSLILWMFGFWTATTFITFGATIAILKL